MFNPKYELTNELLQNIQEIERLYGQLEGMRAPRSLLLNLERDNLVQSSYSSNKIEGNPLSQIHVTNLLLDERVPTNRDEKEVTNHFNILKSLDKKVGKKFNLNIILELHKELLTGVNDKIRGKIRNALIVVGKYSPDKTIQVKHNPPFHEEKEIAKAINDLTSWVETTNTLPILKAGIFHHQFVYIHPFEDGNGRVCRLSTALLFLKNNYLINKYFVLDDYYDIDRDQYSDKLHSADKGDKTEWLMYFTEGVKYSLQSSLFKIEDGLSKVTFNLRPTKKESEALNIIQKYREITSSTLAEELKVSRQQAFNVLKSLTEKRYIEKFGNTKNSYYKII